MDRDTEADFHDFVVSRSPALLATAYLLTGDRHRAEDLLQSALAKALRHWSRLRQQGSVEPYVRRILVNELVDAVLVAGWQGLRAFQAELNRLAGERRAMDVRTLRLRFVERAGPGVLALVTAADTTGQWQAAQWVVRENGRVRPTGGSGGIVSSEDSERRQGSLFSGHDPLFISSAQVCGGAYGVVLAPPDTTARLFPGPRFDAETPLDRPPPGPLPLARGLAVFPFDTSAESSVGVLRGGSILGQGSLGG